MKIKLNLIPPYRQEEIKQGRRLLSVLKWEMELATGFIIFILFLLSANYILKINLSIASGNLGTAAGSSASGKEVEKYDLEFKSANVKIAEIEKIQRGQIVWSNLFEKLNNQVSEEITINSLKTENYLATISGKAKDRDNLIAFKEKLEKEECLEQLDLPLSNLVAKENVDFQISFKVKRDCLEQK